MLSRRSSLILLMAYLTFDWDDVDISDTIVITALQELQDRFGYGNVWYRISSSQTGLHVVIARLEYSFATGTMVLEPNLVSPEVQIKIRQEFAEEPWFLECKGRLISDSVRTQHGFRTGRLFWAKNDNVAKEWQLYAE